MLEEIEVVLLEEMSVMWVVEYLLTINIVNYTYTYHRINILK